MNNVISLGESGMINSLQRLTLISHNLANANTNGYRREIAVSEPFQVHLERLIDTANRRFYTNQSERLVPQTQSVLDMSAGSLRHTGNALDFAIEGDGFFEFAGPDGLYYSRRGVFTQDASGYIVTADGKSVQGSGGGVRLSNGNPRVDREGMIWEDEKNVGQLKVVRFADPTKLEKIGGNYFRIGGATISDGDSGVSLRQGYVENSNVEAMAEMTGMMTALRHLEMTQRVVKSYDDIIAAAIETIGEF